MIEDRLLRVLVAGQRAFPNLTRHAAGAALAVTFSALTIIYATEHYVIGRGIDTYAEFTQRQREAMERGPR